jgi:hypothetical protein
MPAKIIQRNRKPMKKVKVDSVTIDIIESALRNARYEMDTVLFRTAMSPGIREQHDEFPMIANLDGKMVVGQFGSFIWGFMQGYDGTVEEGDIFLTNDPYSVNGAISHLNDWLMLMPIFRDGRVMCLVGDVRPHDRRGRQGPGLAAHRRPHDLRGRRVGAAGEDRQGRCAAGRPPQGGAAQLPPAHLEFLRLQRHRRGAAHRRASAASRSPSASATTCSTRRWMPCSSATSAPCAS